ncbi:hypothetical protein GLYMA_15G250050v4 [Glycine max]|nr:hypothetical protein GLYMA_15G250050v4 [Glycine max]KAH1148756.1 hypothetical protein GYH30_043397 [Glycine max]
MSHFNLHPFLPPPPTIYTPISHSPLSPTHSLTYTTSSPTIFKIKTLIHTSQFKPISTTSFNISPSQAYTTTYFNLNNLSFKIRNKNHSPWHHQQQQQQQQTLGSKPHSLLLLQP